MIISLMKLGLVQHLLHFYKANLFGK